MSETRSLFDTDREALAQILSGEPGYRLDQLWKGLYVDFAEPNEITSLPGTLRSHLTEMLPNALEMVTESVTTDGNTVKWLWRLSDGASVETVLMHYPDRSTVCVSTQAGCAMACGFCATGQGGFERNLSVGEIVEQVVRAARRANEGTRPRRVSNIVFMGMGEPMANYDRMIGAVYRIHGDIGISARHLTISTVGIIPGIKRLAEESLPVNLAVSLHAANDELRDELVPINRRYPLADLYEACEQYIQAKNRRLSFEWALIAGVNDRTSDARELATATRRLRAHVNLIPLNDTPGWPTTGSSAKKVQEFAEELVDLGVNVTVRANRGNDIDAACGQLRANHNGPTVTEVPARIERINSSPKSTI
ncbi:MAG: 23S rRNA (adenine(2503)-C(2))-methyltransferase RlmN [Acidimicrobiales bacterium]